MDHQTLPLVPATVTRNREMDRTANRLQHPPQGRRALVAHGGALAAGQDRRDAATLEAEASVTDRVNTAVKTVESTGLRPPGGRDLRDAAALS